MEKRIILEDILSRVNSSLLKINKTLEEGGGGGGGGQGMTVINATISEEGGESYLTYKSQSDVDTILNTPENVIVVGSISEEDYASTVYLFPVVMISSSGMKYVELSNMLGDSSTMTIFVSVVQSDYGLKFPMEIHNISMPSNKSDALIIANVSTNTIQVQDVDSNTYSIGANESYKVWNIIVYGNIVGGPTNKYSGVTVISFVDSNITNASNIRCTSNNGIWNLINSRFSYYGPTFSLGDNNILTPAIISDGTNWDIHVVESTQEEIQQEI